MANAFWWLVQAVWDYFCASIFLILMAIVCGFLGSKPDEFIWIFAVFVLMSERRLERRVEALEAKDGTSNNATVS